VLIRLSVLLHIQFRRLPFSLHLNLQTRQEPGEHVHIAFCIPIAIYFFPQDIHLGFGPVLAFPGESSGAHSCYLTRISPVIRWPSALRGSPRPGCRKRELYVTVLFLYCMSANYASSFLFRVCRIPTSVLWHYSAIR